MEGVFQKLTPSQDFCSGTARSRVGGMVVVGGVSRPGWEERGRRCGVEEGRRGRGGSGDGVELWRWARRGEERGVESERAAGVCDERV